MVFCFFNNTAYLLMSIYEKMDLYSFNRFDYIILLNFRIMKLHVGCGDVILPGWTNLDIEQLPGVDIKDVIRIFTLWFGVIVGFVSLNFSYSSKN